MSLKLLAILPLYLTYDLLIREKVLKYIFLRLIRSLTYLMFDKC